MSKQSLTPDQVKHIASLAKLNLSEKDLARFQKDLSAILDLVNKLQEVDTSGVEPTSQVTGLTNVFREDVLTSSLSQKDALSNAQTTHKGYFVVPAIFE